MSATIFREVSRGHGIHGIMGPDTHGGLGNSQGPILGTTNTLKRLAKRGYQSALDLYLKISP